MATRNGSEQLEKITISIPASLLVTVDKLVAESKSNRSAVIVELVRKVSQTRFETEMQEGYVAMAGLARELAEESVETVNATWPEW